MRLGYCNRLEMQALISVFDKKGVVEFAKVLASKGFNVISTGGTFKSLQESGMKVTAVQDVTKFPEILGGRVKTLHPSIHGALLARPDQPSHVEDLTRHQIARIGLVAVNLYPFVETVSRADTTLEEALENIDIGGHTLIRAASKNFEHVVIVVDPTDYQWIAQRLEGGGGLESITLGERKKLALKAFKHACAYDSAVANYLEFGSTPAGVETTQFPEVLHPVFEKKQSLRYGENPHQKAALYQMVGSKMGGVASGEKLHGPDLSYNNLLDGDAALRVIREFGDTACCVIKHTNPCGLAVHSDQAEAYRRAFAGDSKSAYGGILGFNRTLTEAAALALKGVFYELIIAPDYEEGALKILRAKEKLRVLKVPEAGTQQAFDTPDIRTIGGGLLLQQPNPIILGSVDEATKSWKVVTKIAPTKEQMADLLFAWRVSKHVKSNAIVVSKDQQIVAIGAGQPNRIQSLNICRRVGGDKVAGSVLASDAFFPFADSIDAAQEAGIGCIVQPGGSIRDQEVIDAADKFGIPMVFTGNRNFLH
ncbi:AICAR transformylase / IMP cyclohydrolase [Cavenderia fasciculata]|uniref:AICAR transformylase / IMP cyclohydrolase n=1 Tax=Cavenderia fasciculata TaxID=261658 RepID=F4PN97_CACFS|nr:AICAR transformylase / IMP cyclohydrolase [Cavenderia fasciculata]EGG22950.1 AICAR transformylase / IMP cyclohydrolase [Cavenderia fasciculata]|eukprot:XP_004360801.1 AICAR transformylase / IMP cyclohydrolase [Cavenderia fasciculata]